MSELLLPLLYALLVWWFSTGLILYLDNLPRRTYRWSLLGASVVTVGALVATVVVSTRSSVVHAYLAFTCGLLVWGWLEMSYLMGIVTGPWTRPCPPDARGLRRFCLAIGTSLYHEIGVIVGGVTLLALTAQTPNPLAAWTFIVLWAMRWSSKLNVYLGVPNLNEEFLPEQLDYLKSFITHKPMNWLFPVSVTVATVICAWLGWQAYTAPPGSYDAAAYGLLAALVLLGTLEHWFLVVPLEDAALWRWALSVRSADRAVTAPLAPAARPAAERSSSV